MGNWRICHCTFPKIVVEEKADWRLDNRRKVAVARGATVGGVRRFDGRREMKWMGCS